MPRRPNTRPTHIYWLIDVRPEVIAAGWPNGQPFYCGKSVHPQKRFKQHLYSAVHGSHGDVGTRVAECKGFIQFHVVEVVPVNGNWRERERHWIKLLRYTFPAVNISDGGEGTPGWSPSKDARRRIGNAQRGKFVSEETRTKLRLARAKQVITEETRAKLRARFKGVKRPEISAATKGRKIPEEVREKIRASLMGRKHSETRRANIAAAVRGKKRPPRSPEHCAKIAANKRAWWAARKAAADV